MSCATLEKSTTDLREGLKAVGDGVAKLSAIDPLALNKLLDENKDLRQQLINAQKQMSDFGPTAGAVNVTADTRIYFQVTGYTGKLRVDAWVNDERNWFMRNIVMDQVSVSLPLPGTIANDRIWKAGNDTWTAATKHSMDGHLWNCASNTQNTRAEDLAKATCSFAGTMPQVIKDIDEGYAAACNAAFVKALQKPFVVPSGPAGQAQSVDQRLKLSGGEHAVFVAVTPLALDSSGGWKLEYRTFSKNQRGDELTISIGQIDSASSAGWKLESRLSAAEAARFFVALH